MRSVSPTLAVALFVSSLLLAPAQPALAADPCDRERELLAQVNRLAQAELDVGFQRHFAEQELDEARRKLDRSSAAHRTDSVGYVCREPGSASPKGTLYELFGDRPEFFGKLVCALRVDPTEVYCERLDDTELRTACSRLADFVEQRDRDSDLPIWVMDQLADSSLEEGDAASGLAALLFGQALENQQFHWCINRTSRQYKTEYDAWSRDRRHRDDPAELLELCHTWRDEWQQAAAEHARIKKRHEEIVRSLNEARRRLAQERKGNRQRGVRCR